MHLDGGASRTGRFRLERVGEGRASASSLPTRRTAASSPSSAMPTPVFAGKRGQGPWPRPSTATANVAPPLRAREVAGPQAARGAAGAVGRTPGCASRRLAGGRPSRPPWWTPSVWPDRIRGGDRSRRAPYAAPPAFRPGQFYRIQNYEGPGEVVDGDPPHHWRTPRPDGGPGPIPERGLISLIVLEMGGSSRPVRPAWSPARRSCSHGAGPAPPPRSRKARRR